ncbi:ATP-binding protein [Actinoplanes sp. NPDC051859]|uniref:sensor histidine kinase n=1 Tax=Actinoplanes sp. NPDC051859 TaxID=3363909 RepID=UPI0037A28AC5
MDDRRVLQTVLDSLETAVLGCDHDGQPVLFNRAARELFGAILDVPLAQWPQRLGVVDGRGGAADPANLPLLRALRGEQVRDAELVVTAGGTAPRRFRVHGRPVPDDTLAAVIALHDVTLQTRAARLKDCEMQISELLSRPAPPDTVMADAVALLGDMLEWSATEFWTLDPVGQVLRRSTHWTSAGHELPDDLPDQLVEGEGLPGVAWQNAEARWAADLHTDPDAAAPGTDWGRLRGALAVPIPSGSATLGVLMCYSDTPETPDDIRTAVLSGIAAHFGEFLERRRAEQTLMELDRTRDEYIALVGHELRTPLTSIQSYTEVMRDEPNLDTAERAQMLDVMHRNTTRVHALIAKLLDVAGLRSGDIALQPQHMDLAAVVQEAAADARTSELKAVIDVNTSPPVLIDGDPHRLRHVVDELLGNALTWAPEGSTVGINVHGDDHTAVLAVSNSGTRIPAEDRARVFDLFFRTSDSTIDAHPGAGLGLTLARAVVDQHGGAITVSEPDEAATTFTVRLPTHHRAPGDA